MHSYTILTNLVVLGISVQQILYVVENVAGVKQRHHSGIIGRARHEIGVVAASIVVIICGLSSFFFQPLLLELLAENAVDYGVGGIDNSHGNDISEHAESFGKQFVFRRNRNLQDRFLDFIAKDNLWG